RRTAPVEPNEQRNAERERAKKRKSEKPWPLDRAERLASEKVAEQKGRQQEVDEEGESHSVGKCGGERRVIVEKPVDEESAGSGHTDCGNYEQPHLVCAPF